MDVGPQAHVVGQVPAVVVRVIINHDLVTVPQPVIAEVVVGRCNAEVETVEPKAVWAAPAESKPVATADAASEASVFPWAIQMEAPVIASGIMPYPLVIGMDVRRLRMPGTVVKVSHFRAAFLSRGSLSARMLLHVRSSLYARSRLDLRLISSRRRPVRRNMPAAKAAVTAVLFSLGHASHRKSKKYSEYSDRGFHDKLDGWFPAGVTDDASSCENLL